MTNSFDIKIPECNTGFDHIVHYKSRLEVSMKPDFVSLFKVGEIVQDVDNPVDLNYLPLELDFSNDAIKYYMRTITFGWDSQLNEEVEYGASSIMAITARGSSSHYNFSGTIIKTPKVYMVTSNRDIDGTFSFECEPITIYKGHGQHTHTEWRLVDSDSVVWHRPPGEDSKLNITLPITLKSTKTYTLEAKFYIGDSESTWGKCTFDTTSEGEDTFDVDFNGTELAAGTVALLKHGQYNHLEVKSKRNSLTYRWTVNENGTTILNDSSVYIEYPNLSAETIVISGMLLNSNTVYTLNVVASDGTKFIRRSFEFKLTKSTLVSTDFNYYTPSNQIITDQAVMLGSFHTVLNFKKVGFYLVDGDLTKEIIYSGSSQSFDVNVPVNLPIVNEFSRQVDIIDGFLVIQGTENITEGVNLVRRRVMYIFHYDPVNGEVFNPTDLKRVVLGTTITANQSLNLSKVAYKTIQVIVTNDSTTDNVTGKNYIRTINMGTGLNDVDYPNIEIDGMSNIVPAIVRLNKSFNIIVGTEGCFIQQHKGVVTKLVDLPSNTIDFTRWFSLVTRRSGEIYIIGLNVDDVEVAKIINVLRLDANGLIFELTKNWNVPLLSGSPIVTQPNIILSENNYIGLSYVNSTYWLT